MSVKSLADDMMIPNVDVHLFISVIILILLLRFFGAPDIYTVALFSCISMPVSYTFSYYVYRKSFVVSKKGGVERSEVLGFLMSYAMGFIVFAALSGSFDVLIYTKSFGVVFLMRVLLMIIARKLSSMDIDISHPLITLLMSMFVAVPMLVLMIMI